MLSESEIRAIAETIVKRAKATARVDQGTLRRSIAYTYVKGLVTFRQIYYGNFGDNSQLEKLASQLMPKGVPYKIELTNLGGSSYEISRTKRGRKSVASVIRDVTKDATKQTTKTLIENAPSRTLSAVRSGNTTKNIRALIASVLNRRRKEDGEKEN